MPPLPINVRISYAPRRVPGAKAKLGVGVRGLYAETDQSPLEFVANRFRPIANVSALDPWTIQSGKDGALAMPSALPGRIS